MALNLLPTRSRMGCRQGGNGQIWSNCAFPRHGLDKASDADTKPVWEAFPRT
jgi:hypothetical protein